MRKLRPQSEESLDLLLDTLCNVFGGIILISCLLAMLTQSKTTPDIHEADTRRLKERLLAERLEAANNELTALNHLADKLAASGQTELQKLADERDQLRATQERLRRLAAKTPVDDTSSKDPAGEIVKLRSEVNALDLQLADAKARIAAANAKDRDLASRIQKIRSQIVENETKRQEIMRFPKEKETFKHPFNFILKYGDVYPLRDLNGKNFEGISHESLGDQSFIARPMPSRGLSVTRDSNRIKELLAECKKAGGYATIFLYPDSFETFRSLKNLINDASLEYGLDLQPENYPIQFSPNGTSPPAL